MSGISGSGHAPADQPAAVAHGAWFARAARPSETLRRQRVAGPQLFAGPRFARGRFRFRVITQPQIQRIHAERVSKLVERTFDCKTAGRFSRRTLEGGYADIQLRQPLRDRSVCTSVK